MSNSGRDLYRTYSLNLSDFGPKGGGADDTAAFNNAISAASARLQGSGLNRIWIYIPADFYRLTNLSLPTGVNLFSDGAMFGPNVNSTGAVITVNGTRAGVRGAYFAGGDITGCSGITVASGNYHTLLENLNFDNFDGRAIYDNGLATSIEDVFAQNCLLGANSLATYTGVIELNGTDAWVNRVEATASRVSSRGMSTGKFACALAVTNANNMIHQYIAETSDHGIYVGPSATQSQFVGVRGELNYGHGWLIAGGSGEMTACHALRNSQAGSNQYDGFNVTAGTWIGRALYSESGGGQPTQNHGLYDSNTSASNYSTWDIKSVGDNIPRGSANSGQTSFVIPENPPLSFTGTTADARYGNTLIAANTAATNLTTIYSVNGQRILIKGDGFTTLVNGANLATLSGSNTLMASGTWYEFVTTAGVVTQTR